MSWGSFPINRYYTIVNVYFPREIHRGEAQNTLCCFTQCLWDLDVFTRLQPVLKPVYSGFRESNGTWVESLAIRIESNLPLSDTDRDLLSTYVENIVADDKKHTLEDAIMRATLIFLAAVDKFCAILAPGKAK